MGLKPLVNLFYTVEFVYNGFVCNVNSPITLHFVRSRWHLSHAFQFACNVISAITLCNLLEVLLQANYVVTLLVNSRGWRSLHVVFSQTRNGNRLYWCNYIRNIDGATQRLKAMVPDRRVWLPALACVIVAVRLNKTFKDAHGAPIGAKQSARTCGPLLLKIAPREMKHALKMHVPVCLYVFYRIRILWLYHVQYCMIFL